jgi:hypothetical protein
LYHWKGKRKTIVLYPPVGNQTLGGGSMCFTTSKLDYNIIALDVQHGNSDGEEFTAVKYSKIIRKVIELYEPQIVIAPQCRASYQEYQTIVRILKGILLGSPNKLEEIMRNYQSLVGFSNRVYKFNHCTAFMVSCSNPDFVSKITRF